MISLQRIPKPLLATAAFGVLWAVCIASWMWFLQDVTTLSPSTILLWVVFTATIPVGIAWLVWAHRPEKKPTVLRSVVYSAVFVAWWQWALFGMAVVDAASQSQLFAMMRYYLAQCGLGALFLIGLGWVVWYVERASQFYDRQRKARHQAAEDDIMQWRTVRRAGNHAESAEDRTWNPLDAQAWIYGKKANKLNQSLTALVTYSALFYAAVLLSTMVGGCEEIYELPAGGGEQKTIAQVVKVQKVIRKKFVVNPFSAILFEVPPIDEVKLQLTEITQHAYQVGQGEGSGQAGFGAGKKTGAVRFIRLQYDGGDWDQDFGVGADVNMLLEYGIRTKHKTAKVTESRTIGQLKNFPVGKSPPLMYMTGQKNISISSGDAKILREYLLDKHGMLFGDNGGSYHFHNQFLEMMRQVLPNVRPVPVPLDDQIHRVPFVIPFLPYVAPHGGREALGWKVEGRWVCYYHPGDIGDAWSDGHSGVGPHIWEACYQLGTNVIFYAHAEYSKWLAARQKED